MKFEVLVAGLVASAAVVNASCPNACNQRGECSQHDMCVCYNGYTGNDCKERACPYGFAWTTTPQGDLNADGDRNDAAIYQPGAPFSSRDYVSTQQQPAGDWEMWPSYAKSGEAHFYMECSNAGLCDTEQGTCQCFDGFEGANCGRMSCPNDCSKKGRCLTISELVAENNAETGSSTAYTLWDSDMVRVCKCDAGFTGPDCSERVCPKGDDPLTKDHQVDHHQIITIYSDNVGTIAAGGTLGGTFTATFTTPTGEKFTTGDIAVSRYGVHADGYGSAHATAVALKNALEALPNKVIPSVEVTAGYCEQVLGGFYGDDFVVDSNNGVAYTGFLRIPNAQISSAAACTNTIIGPSTGTPEVWTVGTPTCAALAIGDTTLTADFDASVSGARQITYPRCIELRVTFSDAANSGSQTLLDIDITKTTNNALTNEQNGGTAHVFKTVSDSKVLAVSADAASVVVAQGDETIGVAAVLTNSQTITLAASGNTLGSATLPDGAEVDIHCDKGSTGTWYYQGRHTITTTVTPADSAAFVLDEPLVDYHTRCTGASNKIKFTLKTAYLYTNVDYAGLDIVSAGYGVKVDSTDAKSAVKSVVTMIDDGADANKAKGYVLFKEAVSAVAAAATNKISLYGAGTKEAETCSSRGICNSESGTCQCFKGYSGAACHTQNALNLGDN